MLKKLILINCFTHPRLIVDFTQGFNYITGRNGRGKTLILEMIAYALFGSRATRGVAEDYKATRVSLTLEVRGVEYEIQRGGTDKVFIVGEADAKATGSAAVNAFIASRLGYTMDVFNVVNYSRQSETELFTSLGAPARKAMVDKLSGLTMLDFYVKQAQNEMRTLAGAIGVYEREAALELIEPTPPTLTMPVEKSEQKLEDISSFFARHQQAKKQLEKHVFTEIPQELIDKKASLETLLKGQSRESLFNESNRQGQQLSRLKVVEGLISDCQKHLENYGSITEEMLDEQVKLIEATKRADLKEKYSKQLVEHCCPACNHRWHDPHPLFEEYKNAEYPSVAPKFTNVQINTLRGMVVQNQEKRDLLAQLEQEATSINSERQNWQDCLTGLQDFDNLSKVSKQIQEIANSNLLWKAANENMVELEKELQEFFQCATMEELQNLRDLCKNELALSAQYLREVDTYNAAKKRVEEAVEKRNQLNHKVEVLKGVIDTVKQVKEQMKTHLTPALSSIATRIITEATEGELNSLKIDDDFNITVNGKAVEKLEGSGVALVNIAMRIALGQILTNGVFSVFLGDEIDKALDMERSGNLMNALKKVSSVIKQVLIVTHKRPEGDTLLHLG